jgi:hypothetical protein
MLLVISVPTPLLRRLLPRRQLLLLLSRLP